MATVSAMQDKSVQKTLESSVKAWPQLDAISQTNGVNKSYHCNGEATCLDGREGMNIRGVTARLNGQHATSTVNKMRFPVLLCPPTFKLRSRQHSGDESKTTVPSKRERKSVRGGKVDMVMRTTLNGRINNVISHNNNCGENKIAEVSHHFNGNHKFHHGSDIPQPRGKSSQNPAQDINCKVFHNNQHSETKMALNTNVCVNYSDCQNRKSACFKCLESPSSAPPTTPSDANSAEKSVKTASATPVSCSSSCSSGTSTKANCCGVTSASSLTSSVNLAACEQKLSTECKSTVFHVPSPVQCTQNIVPNLPPSHPLSRTVTESVVVKSSSSDKKTESAGLLCKWVDCGKAANAVMLKDHITVEHVDIQTSGPYVCKWEGCKVYGKASCNKSWLERHILTHSGDKPFCCIVDGCGLRFTSQYMLERHVNRHFKSDLTGQSTKTKSREDTPSKATKKRKSKKKRPWQVKKTDFVDSWCLERMRHSVINMQCSSSVTSQDTCATDQPSLSFHSSVIGRRLDKSGRPQVLLHWHPDNILPDQWLDESHVAQFASCSVPLSLLPPDFSPVNDDESPQAPYPFYQRHRFRKHRRK